MATLGNDGTFVNVLGFSAHKRAYAMDITTDAYNYNVQNINFYGREGAGGGGLIKPVIWNYTTGAVVTNGVAPEININSLTLQWWTSTFATEPVLAANTRYYVGFVTYNVAGNSFLWGYTSRVSETYNEGGGMSYTTPTTFIPGTPQPYYMMATLTATIPGPSLKIEGIVPGRFEYTDWANLTDIT